MRLRTKFIEILIRILQRDISEYPKDALTKEQYDLLLSGLWQNDSFRKYIANRDAKLIFTMAGSEGMAPEPRDSYVMHTGQRVELLILAREAKAAWHRVEAQKKVVVT